MFAENVKVNRHNTTVYCLVNFNSTLEEDLHRVYTLKGMNMQPYIMIYDKAHAEPVYRRLQRWVNNPIIFNTVPTFEEYDRSKGK